MTATHQLLCLMTAVAATGCASDMNALNPLGDASADVSIDIGTDEQHLQPDDAGSADAPRDGDTGAARDGPTCEGNPTLEPERILAHLDRPAWMLAASEGRVAVAAPDPASSDLPWSIGWVSPPSTVAWERSKFAGHLVAFGGWFSVSGYVVYGHSNMVPYTAWGRFGGPLFYPQSDGDLGSCYAMDTDYCYGSSQSADLARQALRSDAGAQVILAHKTNRAVTDLGLHGTCVYSLEAPLERWLDNESELWATEMDGTRRLLAITTQPQCWYSCDLFAGPRGIVWGETSLGQGASWMPSPTDPKAVVQVIDRADPDNRGAYAVDGSHAYWKRDGRVRRRELCLPLPEEEDVSAAGAREVAVDDTGVYWLSADGLSVHGRSKVL